MTSELPPPTTPATPKAPQPWGRWLLLLLLSAILVVVLELVGLPAALLLGPMVAGIVVSTTGRPLKIGNAPFVAAQAIVGCLMASSIHASTLGRIASDWPIFLAVTGATVAVSALIGYTLSRWQILPGTVAVWGSSPGAASAMVIMAQAYGADARLVAVMTYTRVVCVAGIASVLSLLFAGRSGGPPPLSDLLAIDWLHLAGTLGVAVGGTLLGRLTRLPAGGLLGPLVLGACLNIAGVFDPLPPQIVLGLAFAVIGWRIGLNFTRETVVAARKALPSILAAMLVLIAFCGGLAWLLVYFAGIEPVTAYLATSPGGMDSIAIIASSSNVDQPFVMALQTLRFIVVMIGGPAVAKFAADRHIARTKALDGEN
ncbi:AbrB family transcriptional regulator [Aureimonas psammosilenae]|uniref:AbrB family transcriptional regulator n=1 Tax=Aureimonas psammosilenae TaxID=2495496 RepID=UPI00126116B0|nr:AbrB family transcriptional regulator [Aureimonas psammosilenae]